MAAVSPRVLEQFLFLCSIISAVDKGVVEVVKRQAQQSLFGGFNDLWPVSWSQASHQLLKFWALRQNQWVNRGGISELTVGFSEAWLRRSMGLKRAALAEDAVRAALRH